MSSQDYHSRKPTQPETQSINNTLGVPTFEEEECESMDSANSNNVNEPADPPTNPTQPPNFDGSQCCYPVMFPVYVSPLIPVAITYWPGSGSGAEPPSAAKTESHEVLKPTAVHSKSPINVDELIGMSKLSLGESIGEGGSTSLKLVDGLSRHSAFHANNPGSRRSSMGSTHSPVHAV